MHVGIVGLILVGCATFVGALVQGSVGFGTVIVAFPVVVMVEPELLPQSMLLASLPLVLTVFLRSYQDAVWREVFKIVFWRFPGIAAGVVIVGMVSATALAIAGAVFILGAVAFTAVSPPIQRTTATLAAAGVASGFFGTSVGIGGPPVGLLYQGDTGAAIRGTVGTVGLFGIISTLVGLAIGGSMSGTDLRTGLALMPFGLAGALCAKYVLRWADQRVRSIVQVISVMGAILALAKVVL